MSRDSVLSRLTEKEQARIVEYVALRIATSQDGEHLIWSGSTGGTHRNPIVKFGNRTVMIRRWILDYSGIEIRGRDMISNICEVDGCVLPSHLGLLVLVKKVVVDRWEAL